MIKRFILILCVCIGLSFDKVSAQTNTLPPPDPALQKLLDQVNAKIDAGKNTEAEFAPELKQFDALIAAHQSDANPDLRALMSFLKARLYLEVLGDLQTGGALMKKVQTDYPQTEFGITASNALVQIQQLLSESTLATNVIKGAPLPDFNEKDLSGNPLSVSSHKGKVVLLDFWATWCVPCRIELPGVIATYKKYHDQGFDIIGITSDDDTNELATFLKHEPDMAWPQYFDGGGRTNKLAVKYGVMAIPTTILIDRDGKVIATNLRGDRLEKTVADALTKK